MVLYFNLGTVGAGWHNAPIWCTVICDERRATTSQSVRNLPCCDANRVTSNLVGGYLDDFPSDCYNASRVDTKLNLAGIP